MGTSNNNKTLSFQIVYGKVYNVVWEGVSLVDTLIVSMISSISHTFVSSATVNFVHNLGLSIPITGTTKALVNFVHTITQNISQTYVVKEILKVILTNTTGITNSFIFKEILKAVSSINLTNTLSMTPILAIVNTLGSFDSGALSAMDTETLGDLDYTIL